MDDMLSDLAALQDLLDRSTARAWLWPEEHHHARATSYCTADLLPSKDGISLLALATVTSDCRPLAGPVDGNCHRGAFHFGSSPDSVRFRHISRRPQVSATHLPGEEFAVTVHGRAVPIDVRSADHAGFRRALLDVYVPRYGPEWETFLDSGPVYARIDADRMFTFHMNQDTVVHRTDRAGFSAVFAENPPRSAVQLMEGGGWGMCYRWRGCLGDRPDAGRVAGHTLLVPRR